MGKFFNKIINRVKGKTFSEAVAEIARRVVYFIPFFWIFPIDRKKVIFDNFYGRGYGDDPKYIAEALRRNNPGVKLFWLFHPGKDISEVPPDVTLVQYGSVRAAFHWNTAAVWVDNVKNSTKPKLKRKGQYYIQTWHSCLGLKKNEQDVEEYLPALYVETAKKDSALTDLMYSNNEFRLEKYRNHYWYDGEVLKCSVPRMKPFFSDTDELKEHVCSKLGISAKYKLVLYAPTFRDKKDKAHFSFEYHRIIEACSEKYQGEFKMLIRLHPLDNDLRNFFDFSDPDIVDAHDYSDMQELLATCDVLITDYSGTMFDCCFVEKPVFLLAMDLDEYKKERDTYFQFEELPFSCAEDGDGLVNNIYLFDSDAYRIACRDFNSRIGLEENGRGDEYLADIILRHIGLR